MDVDENANFAVDEVYEDEETCEWCGGDLDSDGVCVDETCDGGDPDELDESREYRGPGCSPSCGC